MPPVSINSIEAFWIGVNSLACLVTALALWDAWKDNIAIKALNGRAREIAASGNVRREALRLIAQTALLMLVLPSAFDDGDIPLSPFVIDLIAIAVILLVATLLDLRDRKRLIGIVASDLDRERRQAMARIERQGEELAAAMQANTVITQQASDHADAAYHEANSVNQKIATQGAAIIAQGEERRAERLEDLARTDRMEQTADRVETTGDETAVKVEDIHQAVIDPPTI